MKLSREAADTKGRYPCEDGVAAFFAPASISVPRSLETRPHNAAINA
jgi:hypothetical protein